MTVPFCFPVVIFSNRNWCVYFDTTDGWLSVILDGHMVVGDLRFIPTNGQTTVPLFPVIIFPVIIFWRQHKTQNTTHTDTTINKMSGPPYPPASLTPHSPWVEQWRHQIVVPPLPNTMRRPRAVRVALAVVGLLAWGSKIRGIK